MKDCEVNKKLDTSKRYFNLIDQVHFAINRQMDRPQYHKEYKVFIDKRLEEIEKIQGELYKWENQIIQDVIVIKNSH